MGDISKDVNSKFADAKVKALINILYTASWINNIHNGYFKPYGISPQQYNILRILNGANEPLKVQIIKSRMIDRSPNATRLMDKLCAKQLIDRVSFADDRRVVHIVITDKGRQMLEDISDNFNDEILKNITENEANQLSDLLDKLR